MAPQYHRIAKEDKRGRMRCLGGHPTQTCSHGDDRLSEYRQAMLSLPLAHGADQISRDLYEFTTGEDGQDKSEPSGAVFGNRPFREGVFLMSSELRGYRGLLRPRGDLTPHPHGHRMPWQAGNIHLHLGCNRSGSALASHRPCGFDMVQRAGCLLGKISATIAR